MKISIVSTVIFIMILLLTACSGNQSGKATVFLAPDSTNLGEIPTNKTIGISFAVVNETDENHTIISQAKSCGCTELKLKSKLVKAHDRVKVYLQFDPEKESGKFEKSVFLRMDNGEILVYKFKGIAQR